MASIPPNNSGAIVLDASVAIAIAAKEAGREPMVLAELARYSQLGYSWFAPGVIIAETLYVVCGKKQRGELSGADYVTAISSFKKTVTSIIARPDGDWSLIARAEQIVAGYGCSHSADGIYIALAEDLAATRPTVLLTLYDVMSKQAARNAATINVQALT